MAAHDAHEAASRRADLLRSPSPDLLPQSTKPRPRLPLLLLMPTIVAAIWIATFAVQQTLVTHHALPISDEWDFVHQLGLYYERQFGIQDLWLQHNEHRLFFPRFIFLADALLFGCNGWLSIACTFALVIAQAWWIGRVADRLGAPDRHCRAAAIATTFALLLHRTQLGNFFIGFQVQFPMVLLGAFGAFVALANHRQATTPRRAGLWLAVTVAAGTLSIGSMASGVMTWPLLVFLAIVLRVRKSTLALLIVLGAALVVGYLQGYRSPDGLEPDPARLWKQPLETAKVLCGVMGAPLWFFGPKIAIYCGGVTLLVWLGWLLRLATRWRTLPPLVAAQATYLAWVIGFAVLCTVGRGGLNIYHVIASRYATPVLIGQAILVSAFLNRSRLPRSVRLLAAAALAIVMVAVPGRSFRETYDNQNDAAYCLMAGVDDGATLRRSHDVDPEATRRKAQILRKHRLSVFGDGVHLLMGMPLGDAFRVRTTPLATSCIDEVVPLQASPLALEWKGWAFDPGSGRGIDLLVAVDQGGTIVGLGHGDLARPDVAASNYGFPTADSGWRLWSKNDPADLQRPRLYAVLADRSAVPLAGQ